MIAQTHPETEHPAKFGVLRRKSSLIRDVCFQGIQSKLKVLGGLGVHSRRGKALLDQDEGKQYGAAKE